MDRLRAPALLSAVAAIAVAACSGSAATPAATAVPTAAAPTVAIATPAVATTAPTEAPTPVATLTPAPTPSPSAEPSATPEPSASEAPSASESASPSASVPDLTGLTENLSHLASYVEDFTQTGGTNDLQAHVVIVRGASPQEQLDLTETSGSTHLILTGNTTYYDSGTGRWVKGMMSVKSAQAAFNAFDPGVFLASFKKIANFNLIPMVGTETKNGVQAIHFHADDTTNLGPGKPTVPPGAVFDVWISTDGDYLVALEYSGVKEASSGKVVTGSIELTHVNDSSLSVKAPI